MADVIITPASGLIDFQNVSGISSATIQLDGNGNLALSAAGGDIQIGDTSADIFIGDGINNVDLIFEEDGEIRGLTGKTITLGQSDSFISFAGDITGNITVTGTVDGRDIASDGSKLDGIESGATADQTASEILTAIKTVDGAGSGLDADTLDGVNSGSFLRSDAADTATGLLTLSGGLIVDGSIDSGGNDYAGYRSDSTNIVLKGSSTGVSGIFFQSEKNGTNINHGSDYGYIQYHAHGIDGTTGESGKLVIGVANDATDTLVLQSPYKNGVKISFKDTTSGTGGTEYTVWHGGNDGTGSGLDADTLDGIQGASFVRNDVGSQEVQSYLTINDAGNFSVLEFEDSSNVQRAHVYHANASSYAGIAVFDSSGANRKDLLLYQNGTITWNNNTVWHAGNDGSGSGLDADTIDGIQADRIPYGSDNLGTTANTNPGQNLRSGFFDVNGTANGAPTNSWYSYINIRHTNTSSGWGHQIAGNFYDNGELYNRHYDSGNYAGWTKIWNAANDGSGSGLDADLLDGAQPSVSASNSTIVQRHSSGYIYANYFNTTPNDVTSGVTKVLVETGNDGFMRHGTADAIRSFINVESGATADQTASEILTAIKTVDGAGSGLDADLLDGISSASFLRSDANDTATGSYLFQRNNAAITNSSYVQGNNHIELRTNNASNPIIGFHRSGYTATALYHSGYGSGSLRMRNADGNDGPIFSTFNDGAGSGLDADTVDGIQGASFMRSDASTSTTGNLTVNGVIFANEIRDRTGSQLVLNAGEAEGKFSGQTGELVYLNAEGGILVSTPDTGHSNFESGYTQDSTRITGTYITIDGNTAWHAGNDGAGSGLDADLWDGNQFATYLNQAVLTTSSPSFNQVITTNNGNGTNVRIGDDAWIGDINAANTIRVQGVQNGANGYIVFGNSNTTALGRAGTGALTYGGSTIWHAGNDGAGSGLDADTLDGTQLSNLMTLSGTQTITGDKDFDGTLTYDLINGPNTNTRDKVRVWTSSEYSIGMKSGFSYGGLGGSGTNYAMSFQMSNTNDRGWWWGDSAHTDAQGAASLTTLGKMTLAHSLRIGYGESDTTIPGATHRLDVSGSILATGDITAFSDINLKENIEVIPNALDKVSQIRGVTFIRKDLDDKSRKSGVIAQEVEKVLPEVVTTTEDGTKTVAYGNLVGLLIESIKELKAEVEELKKERN